MYNIKIKSVPNRAKTGQQLDYSLVDRNTLFLKPDTQVQSDVKNTISAVPRNQANIEAEGGETIIGDTNNDGFLEHQTIVGKRHSKGGVPLNVPEGSFIFSDTKNLTIKDQDVLKVFGMPGNKKGFTPAEIAKKYQVNDYIAILKDDTKDKYSKETAQVMLDSNLRKLGMLALVQESMKGFPDGVPSISESVMGNMMSSEEEPLQSAQRGGFITKAPVANKVTQDSTQVASENPNWDESEDFESIVPGAVPLDQVTVYQKKINNIPKIGDIYYVNGSPVTLSEIETSTAGDWLPNWINDPSGVYFRDKNNKKYYLTFDEFKSLRKLNPETGDLPVLTKHGRTASSSWTADSNRAYNFSAAPVSQPGRVFGNKTNPLRVDQNDVLELQNGKYKVIDTQYGVNSEFGSGYNPIEFITPSYYEETIRAKNLTTGQIEELRLADLYENLNSGFAKNLTKNPEAEIEDSVNSATGAVILSGKNDTTNEGSLGIESENKAQTVKVGKPKPTPVIPTPKSPKPVVKKPVTVEPEFGGFEVPTDTSRGYAYGGGVYKMQNGGKARFNPDTGMWQNYDAQGKPVGEPYAGPGVTYNVKDKDVLEKARALGYDVIGNKFAPNINYIPEQTSKTGFTWNPESGYYESKDLRVGKEGLEETINIWKDELEQYEGPSGKGVEAWRKDFLNQKGKEGVASKYLVDKANEYSIAAGAGPQVDVTKKAAYVPGQDVFTLKKFKKIPVQKAEEVSTQMVDKEVPVTTISPTASRKTRGWFTPDMLNLANAFSRRIGKFPPTLQQVNLETGPYNLMSPASEIARIQSSASQLGNQAANTMAGNVALAASTGLQGQALDRVADTLGRYNNANVGISNEASRYGSGVANQEEIANAELRSIFNRENATYGQNLINSINAKNLGITKAFNKGWDNSFKANLLEDMIPQVGIDRVFGDIGWSGVGKNPFEYDTSYSGSTGVSGKSSKSDTFDETDMDEYERLFNLASTKMSKENAHKFALQGISSKKSRNNNYDQTYNPAEAMTEGLSGMFG